MNKPISILKHSEVESGVYVVEDGKAPQWVSVSLIASATELLEELERLVRIAEPYGFNTTDAQDVIKKAKGTK